MEQKHRLPGACSAGCSAIAWETADGRHLFGRNFDYNRVAADSKVTCFPPGTELCTRGTSLDHSQDPAARRRADYGAVGMGTTVLGATPVLYEGLNERGLMGAQLYYRGYARYPDRPAEGRLPLQPPFLVTLCLACCATVEEAARLLTEEVSLVGEPLLGAVPPLHWMFSDPTGESVVVEPDGDGLHLYRNTVGVMTNSPPYPGTGPTCSTTPTCAPWTTAPGTGAGSGWSPASPAPGPPVCPAAGRPRPALSAWPSCGSAPGRGGTRRRGRPCCSACSTPPPSPWGRWS